jgi:hypothetical protein
MEKYYTVHLNTNEYDEVVECDGTKTIYLYNIEHNVPKQIVVIECDYTDISEEIIHDWLWENDFDSKLGESKLELL